MTITNPLPHYYNIYYAPMNLNERVNRTGYYWSLILHLNLGLSFGNCFELWGKFNKLRKVGVYKGLFRNGLP